MTAGKLESAHILLVEDDPGDVAITLDELQELRLGNRITVLHNGLHAIDYLERRGAYQDAATRPYYCWISAFRASTAALCSTAC